jgi:hypothetical protein
LVSPFKALSDFMPLLDGFLSFKAFIQLSFSCKELLVLDKP